MRPPCSQWQAVRSSRSRVKVISSIGKFQARGIGRLALRESWTKYEKPSRWLLLKGRRKFSLAAKDNTSIYALSTAPGRAAIAIIRVSGPACLAILHGLCPHAPPPKPRYAGLRTLYEPGTDPADAQILDSGALVLYFPAPETVTGEDVLEFHVHGGTAVVKAVLAAIPKAISNETSQAVHYAEPGEFTRRAFYNNRLDLLQIEALGDTLAAETEQQRRQAVRGSSSVLAERYEAWRQKLLYARGQLEAIIDFSEDQHFDESPAELCASVTKQVQELKYQLQANIENGYRGELLRNGLNIALIGAPNAGKSSLLNHIVGREAAIVSSEAGTTRDVVDVNIDIGGYYCRFGDLAGLRKESQGTGTQGVGEVEKEGMRRAKQRALAADVVIAVFAAKFSKSNGTSSETNVTVEVTEEVLETLKQCDMSTQKVVCVLNKADLFDDQGNKSNQRMIDRKCMELRDRVNVSETTVYAVSCRDAHGTSFDNPDPGGIQGFLDGLAQLFEKLTSAVSPFGQEDIANNSTWAQLIGVTERQRVLLQECLRFLESFLVEVQPGQQRQNGASGEGEDIDAVVAAEHLRGAADCLAKITGRGEAGNVEEVLGVVFEKFCVGK